MLNKQIPIEQRSESQYRWVMLAVASLTPTFVVAMPTMSLPVLFAEIAQEFDLSLLQVGIIWGISSFTGMFVGLLGGAIGDRFGTRNTLIITCFLSGAFGMLRGFTSGFGTFIVASFLLGLVQPMIPINVSKVAIEWFSRKQLGMATGFVSAGFATGLMLGALISGSILSPALGGWRNVLHFYGIASVLFSLLWWILHPGDAYADEHSRPKHVPLRRGLPHVIKLRQIWLLGLGGLGVRACVVGLTGYLPTYLREIGWANNSADNALALFFGVSLVGVIPLSMLSDRLNNRREFLIVAALAIGTGAMLLTVADGVWVWVAVMFSGFVFDAFMAIYIAAIMETPGIGKMYAGTALGFAGLIRNIGGTLSPPIGNSIAEFGLNLPFGFWGAMAILGTLAFVQLRVIGQQDD